jgi:hypothetical protein
MISDCRESSCYRLADRPLNLTDDQEGKRKEYAMHFLILFLPVRTISDLQPEHGRNDILSRFDTAFATGSIWNDGVKVAGNIQNIHNSVWVGIPEDPLTRTTKEFM